MDMTHKHPAPFLTQQAASSRNARPIVPSKELLLPIVDTNSMMHVCARDVVKKVQDHFFPGPNGKALFNAESYHHIGQREVDEAKVFLRLESAFTALEGNDKQAIAEANDVLRKCLDIIKDYDYMIYVGIGKELVFLLTAIYARKPLLAKHCGHEVLELLDRSASVLNIRESFDDFFKLREKIEQATKGVAEITENTETSTITERVGVLKNLLARISHSYGVGELDPQQALLLLEPIFKRRSEFHAVQAKDVNTMLDSLVGEVRKAFDSSCKGTSQPEMPVRNKSEFVEESGTYVQEKQVNSTEAAPELEAISLQPAESGTAESLPFGKKFANTVGSFFRRHL